LAAIALISFWFIPSAAVGGIPLTNWDGVKLILGNMSQLSQTGLYAGQQEGLLFIGFLSLAVATFGGLIAFSSNLTTQAAGGILGLAAWFLPDIIVGPAVYQSGVQNLGGAYISIAAYLGLALVPLIARFGSYMAPPVQKSVSSFNRATVRCASCGSFNVTSNRFCGNCGTAVVQVSSVEKLKHAETSLANQRFCEQCTAAVDPDDAFCGWCGTKIEKEV